MTHSRRINVEIARRRRPSRELDRECPRVHNLSCAWHFDCSIQSREIRNDCSREEPSNEAFINRLDHSDCRSGAVRHARRQLGPAGDSVHVTASADHRCAFVEAVGPRRWWRRAAGVRERASASGAVGTRRHPGGFADRHRENARRRAEATPQHAGTVRARRRRDRRDRNDGVGANRQRRGSAGELEH
jgi:hypothetical protein